MGQPLSVEDKQPCEKAAELKEERVLLPKEPEGNKMQKKGSGRDWRSKKTREERERRVNRMREAMNKLVLVQVSPCL